MKKFSIAIVVLAVVCAANCNVNLELMNGLRGLLGSPVNAGAYVQGCENFPYFFQWDISRAQIDGVAAQQQDIRWLKGPQKRNLPALLRELKFGRKAVSLTFENHITSGRSGVLAKAFVALRTGDQVSARGAMGSATCDMKQQFNTVSYKDCKRILFVKKCKTKTKQVPRGFQPHELMTVLNHLQYQASKTMYDLGKSRTGLSSDAFDMALESLYLTESHALRRFYPEIKYDYTEMDDVPLQELQSAISQASQGQINDQYIYNRINQIVQASARSSFFHVPNASVLYAISVNRMGANFLVRMSSFQVNSRLPAGALAWSTGAWNLERPGQGTSPSSNDLMRIFPPLK